MNGSIERRAFFSQGARALAAAGAACAAGASWPATASAVEPIARTGSRRFRIACAAYSLRKYLELQKATMTVEEFIQKCAGWGTDGVELTEYYIRKPITLDAINRLKRMAIIWGQDITGSPIGNNFALPPGRERDRQLEAMREWIDVSADLGSPAIRIFAGSAPKGVTDAQTRKWVVECIHSVCDHAARRGVFLAIENHGGVVATVEGLLEIIKAVDSEWVGVNLDTGNFHSADPYADLAQAAPYAVTCQLKVDITAAGKPREDVDIGRIGDLLRKANYRGYVTLEYEGTEEPLDAVPRWLERMRKELA